jgi:hypothetical protein
VKWCRLIYPGIQHVEDSQICKQNVACWCATYKAIKQKDKVRMTDNYRDVVEGEGAYYQSHTQAVKQHEANEYHPTHTCLYSFISEKTRADMLSAWFDITSVHQYNTYSKAECPTSCNQVNVYSCFLAYGVTVSHDHGKVP